MRRGDAQIRVGDLVETDLGSGLVTAVTDKLCLVLTHPDAPPGQRETVLPLGRVMIASTRADA